MKLSGKTAVVTGAAAGMGKAIAVLFAAEGAKVIAADIDEKGIAGVVSEIKDKGGEATGVVANMAKQKDVENMIDTAIKTYGSLDVLVNNAGIVDNFVPVGDYDDALWDKVIAINLTGPFKAARAAIKVMQKQKNGGIIINNASVGGLFGTRGGAGYIASKHGLIGLTKNIAATYGMYGNIRSNAIAPGGVATSIQSTVTKPHSLGMQALGNSGKAPEPADPRQIATVALFLASDDSSFVNGETIRADGGWTVG